MKTYLAVILTFILFNTCSAQQITLADSAKLFAPGVIANGDFSFNASFTPDNQTVFFSRSSVNFGFIAIFFSTKKGDKWAVPQAVSFTGQYRDTDPFVSADGKRLYFSSDRPLPGKPFKDYDYHLFYVSLSGPKITSAPVLVDLPVTVPANYCTFAANNNVYFSAVSNGDSEIYRCVFKDGGYLPPEKLSFNDPKFIDFDPAIASNESFIVFTSNNRKGIGAGDLWISFRKDDKWNEPVNMGNKVNTKGTDGSPGLSPDNQTLYFSSSRETIGPNERLKQLTTSEIYNKLHGYKNGLRNIYSIRITELIQSGNK